MDRKIIFAFIVIYSFAASAGLVFGETGDINVTSVDVKDPEPTAARSKSDEAVATVFRPAGVEVSDIVQLPMIIVRPEPVEEEAVEEP